MVLSDQTILELVKKNDLITPFDKDKLQPASYDLSVGEIQSRYGDLKLKPHESRRISTKEKVNLPNNVAAFCKTKSSFARIGINTGDIGGWIDPGYRGEITLFVTNLSDKEFNLKDIDSFAQIIFLRVDRDTGGYAGNYQDSTGVVNSILEKND